VVHARTVGHVGERTASVEEAELEMEE
jgi:hypothetical protein